MRQKRFIVLCVTFLLTILTLAHTQCPFVGAQVGLEITVTPNKVEYYQRDRVEISGNLSYGTEPVSDELVGLQVNDPRGNPIVYRALSAGGTPTVDGLVEIQGITAIDYATAQPKISFKIGTDPLLTFKVTIRNNGPDVSLRATLTVFDGNMVPMGATSLGLAMPHGITIWSPSITFDETSAYVGPAKTIVTLFTDIPSNGGIPRAVESVISFGIVRGDISTSSVPPPSPDDPTSPGAFNTTFRFGPQPSPGLYTVYVSSAKYGYTALNSTVFQVKSSRLEAPSPPQASFTFSPLRAFANAPVRFDALASSPENYNDTITGYEWDWGDGSPKNLATSPSLLHVFASVGTYNVTLKVTDQDATWGISTKPVNINPPDPPIADFAWSPILPMANFTTTLDASISQPGWNGTHNIPIVSYRWDFGDGNVSTVATPLINHTFTQITTYSVALTVTDNSALQDSQTYLVVVYQAGDINGDGKVDGRDVAIAAKAFGTRPGDSLWDARADVNGDGRVDGRDIAVIAKNFGQVAGAGGVQDSVDASSFAFEVAATANVSPPQALFSFTPVGKYVDTFIVFDASASSPENFDDRISGFEWDWGDGSPKSYATSPSISHKFVTPGTYNVTLRVTDTDSWCIATKPITIQPPDLGQMAVSSPVTSVSPPGSYQGSGVKAASIGPMADFTWTPFSPVVGWLVSFDAGASYDPDGTIVLYTWSWGDGTSNSSSSYPTMTHTFMALGDRDVTLTVTDLDGLTGIRTQTISVVFGSSIDVFVGEQGKPRRVPYGGQGQDKVADMFEPQKAVCVWALATYNGWPVMNKLVTFIVVSPHNLYDSVREAITNATGYAYVEFGLPWPCVDPVNEIFGTWNITALVDFGNQVVEDTVAFKAWYLIEVTAVVPKHTSFYTGDIAGFDVFFRTYRMQPIDGVIELVVLDDLGVPIGLVFLEFNQGWGNYTWNQLKNYTLQFGGTRIPKWAFVGTGTAYVNAFYVDYANPYNMGSQCCPEAFATFNILKTP